MTKREKAQRGHANVIWGGHYREASADLLLAINSSIHFDQLLWAEDIAGSRAHIDMLEANGIVSKEDAGAIRGGLDQIEAEIREGRFEFSSEHEDIHMNIEARLSELIGEAAGRLHTARSRNDQVAVDFRMFVRARLDECVNALEALIGALLDQAESGAKIIMPGFTHLQSAQPVSFGHHLMAYVEMFGRDIARFGDARARMNECPLGAAALAGTSFPIDRHATASALGFDRPAANSMDAVADRDFALEFLAAASICALHLSRLGEELVIFSSAQFGFVRISEKWTTGSSIMPQKRNPDAAELIRAKIGRINGAYQSLLMVMKGLPLTYSKDMQEDKEPLFDGAASLHLAIRAMSEMIRETTPNEAKMREAAGSGYSSATDLADWLVRELDLPFREAHHITGKIVNIAEARAITLAEISLEEMQGVHKGIHQGVFDVLDIDASVNSRNSYGGTAPDEVKRQIGLWRTKLANARKKAQ